MKEIKIFVAVFILTVFVCSGIIFFAIYNNGARIDFFPGQDSGKGDAFGLSVLLSSIIGGILGSVIGILSVGYLVATFSILGEQKAPMWTVLAYSVLIGCFLFLLFFREVSGQYSTYTLAFKDNWIGSMLYIIAGFLIGFIPMISAKKYFNI